MPGCYTMPGCAGVLACFQGGAVGSVIPTCREPHHSLPGCAAKLPAPPSGSPQATRSGVNFAGREQGRGQPRRVGAHPDNTTAIKYAKYLIPAILLLSLVACKSPAVITNNESHHARDSTRHTSIQRIETHDTIIIGPQKPPLSPP